MVYIKELLISLIFLISSFCFAQKNNVNPNGFNQFFYDNGNISSEGYLVNGKPNGFWKTYNKNGALKSEGFWSENKLDSVWKFYNLNGDLNEVVHYDDGVKHGVYYKYDIYGNKIVEKSFVNDTLTGIMYEFYTKDRVHYEKQYSNNKLQGSAYEFDTLGNIITLLAYNYDIVVSKEKINRTDALGKKKGVWLTFFDNDLRSIKTETNYENDLINGYLKEYDITGNLLKFEKYEYGQIVKDSDETIKQELKNEYHQNGKLKAVGSLKRGKKEGLWRFYDEEGKPSDNKIYVDGVLISEGLVNENGQKNGEWIYYYPTGELYSKGKYANGLRNGKWNFYFENGEVEQTGNFNKKGNFDGMWIWYYPNREIHREEEFYDGLADGIAVEYDSAGLIIIKGTYSEDYKTGDWLYQLNDHKEYGAYIDDEKTGEWIHTYNNGKIRFKGDYVNGLPHQKHVYYYLSGGIKKEENWVMGEKDGDFNIFSESGELILNEKYKMGTLKKVAGKKVKQEDVEE